MCDTKRTHARSLGPAGTRRTRDGHTIRDVRRHKHGEGRDYVDNRLVTGIGRRLAMRFRRHMPYCRAFWSFGGASRLSEHPRRAQAPRDRGVRGCDRRGLCNAASAGEVDSSATLRVEPSTSLVGGSVQADDVKYLDRVVNTYSQLASSPEMGNRVAAELHLAAPPDIEFAQVPNTNLVKLKVTTGDRDSAAPAAGASHPSSSRRSTRLQPPT